MSRGRHGKARAVDHAADRAVERDIGEVVFGRLDLLGVLFRQIAQLLHVRMAVEGVGIEGDLGIEAAQLAVGGDDQRVDLEHLHVLRDEGVVELHGEIIGLLGQITAQAERLGDRAPVMGHGAGGGVDGDGVDLLRRVMGDLLDIHAAFRRDHEGDAARGAIDQRGEIEFLLDIGAVLDIEAVDLLAVIAGLHRDEGLAEHLGGEFLHLVDGLGQAHAALLARIRFLELALAATAGMDLALDHPERAAELLRRSLGLLGGEDRDAARDGRAKLLQECLALVFMDIHGNPLSSAETRAAPPGRRAAFRKDHFASSGLIFLQASTRPVTEATDFSNMAFSSAANSTSTMRSTPFSPITIGTPTNRPSTPY